MCRNDPEPHAAAKGREKIEQWTSSEDGIVAVPG
jgi:hypothetical protein